MLARSSFYTSSLPDTVDSLSELLNRELQTCGIECGTGRPRTLQEFSAWYLQVIQLLEAHVAGAAELQPITRTDLELMCRCALSAGNLRSAVLLCEQFCAAIYPRAGKLQMCEDGSAVSVRLDSLRAFASSTSSLCDITGLFAFGQLFQWLVGVDLQLRQVRIGPIDRNDLLPFLKLFGAPVLAGGQDYALEFPVAVLDLPVVRTPSEFEQFFAQFPCGVFHSSVTDLSQQVAALLAAAARLGANLPTQDQLARSLGLPLSTFRRRLADDGCSFHQLRVACLQERAEHLLVHRKDSIADVASQLGYSDAAAFRRAFKQWRGCAPNEWRMQQLRTDEAAR